MRVLLPEGRDVGLDGARVSGPDAGRDA